MKIPHYGMVSHVWEFNFADSTSELQFLFVQINGYTMKYSKNSIFWNSFFIIVVVV